jgi:hypothetical protein
MCLKSIFRFACFILLFVPLSFAQTPQVSVKEPAAFVVSIVGTAMVQTEAQEPWKPLEVDMPLSKDARIKTSPASSVHIGYERNVMFEVLVAQDTEIVIDDLIEKQKLLIEKGQVFIRAKKLDEKLNFEVTTPSCVIGVRGTEWETELYPSQTLVSSYEGLVKTQGVDDQGKVMAKEVGLEAGRGTRVAPKQDPLAAFELSQERFDHWLYLRKIMFSQLQQFQKTHPDRFRKLYEQKEEMPPVWKHLKKSSGNDATAVIAGTLLQQGLKSIGKHKDDDHRDSSGSNANSSSSSQDDHKTY